MSESAYSHTVINTIDVHDDGTLKWSDDHESLDRCEDCGTQGFEDWHAPDRVWKRLSWGDSTLCWSCFMLRVFQNGVRLEMA